MSKVKQFNGYAFFVAVMRELDPNFRRKLLAKIQEKSPLLVRLVDEFEFIFNDIVRLDDRSIQIILREIPENEWLSAWKLSNDPIKQLMLKNMSDRKRQEFISAFEHHNKTRVPKRQVVSLQASIGRRIKNMLCAGKLGLRSKRYFTKEYLR